MRLLEFGREKSGANPLRTGTSPSPSGASGQTIQTAVAPSAHPRGKPVPLSPVGGIKIKPAGRRPVDLGQLKQRIELLERRMRAQSEKLDELASAKKLDQLKQRMLHLEQRLAGELGTARQRELTLLEMLHRPPFTQLVKQRLTRFWRQDLPTAGHWLQRAAQVWWRDSQPCWWPQLVRAWQMSLEQARNGTKDTRA